MNLSTFIFSLKFLIFYISEADFKSGLGIKRNYLQFKSELKQSTKTNDKFKQNDFSFDDELGPRKVD